MRATAIVLCFILVTTMLSIGAVTADYGNPVPVDPLTTYLMGAPLNDSDCDPPPPGYPDPCDPD